MWELREVPVWKDGAILKDEKGNIITKLQWKLETAEGRYVADGAHDESELNKLNFSECSFATKDGRPVFTENAFGKLIKTFAATEVRVSKAPVMHSVKIVHLD